MGTEAKQSEESPSNELTEVAREEQEFVRQTLQQKLGREPTENEVNEWLREHTESY
jgi:DNA-directed RNA polymerase specialized sigma subunit